MRLQKSPLSEIERAFKAALESSTNEEDDREFRDFIESVSVTQDELAAIIGMSECHSVSVKPGTFELEQGANSEPAALGPHQWNSFSNIRTRLMARARQLGTLALLSLGLAGLGFSRRKQ